MLNPPPKQILMRLPRLYCTEDKPPAEKVIHLHFFIGNCDWFVAEFDGEDTFFGFANLGDPQMAEWGYFTLSELRGVRVTADIIDDETKELMMQMPVFVEWDEHWTAKPFGQLDWERRRW